MLMQRTAKWPGKDGGMMFVGSSRAEQAPARPGRRVVECFVRADANARGKPFALIL